jgi:Xaa-Pro dipeptidase
MDRRGALKAGGLTLLGSAFLTRVDRVAAMQSGRPSLTEIVRGQATGASEKRLLRPPPAEDPRPAPATYDRLPLEWNKRTVARFKARLKERNVEAFMIRSPAHIIYLTGYWHTTTERPQAIYFNDRDTAPWYFYPILDRDLVRTWWFGGGRDYFDMPHTSGAAPHEGIVHEGPRLDLFRFMLEGVREHGVQGKRIGIDRELSQSEARTAAEVLPQVEWVGVTDILDEMMQVKTPEELALWSRSYVYFDRAHGFARDYILTHGTDVTDYEVAQATSLWINDLLFSELDLGNGRAHHGVASAVRLMVRAGPVTAYPHPNQPYFNRIGRNMTLQIQGAASIGGYGGENHRSFIIADRQGRFDPHMRRLWEAGQVADQMQVDLTKEGVVASSIAKVVHDYQVRQGLTKYMYQRPAHGVSGQGHQAPFIALGDDTVLKQNMCFAQHAGGFFDTERGVGISSGDTIVVGKEKSYLMSRVPHDKEWCWIRL